MNKKFYRALTLGVGLMLAGGFTVNAQQVTFNGEEMTLKQAFSKIEAVSKYKIAYNASQLDVDKTVVLSSNSQDVLTVINDLLKDTGCTYQINDNYIVITSESNSIHKK